MNTLFPRKQDDLFPSLFGSGLESDFFNRFFGEHTFPQVDIKEMNDRYEFTVDLPGFSKEDIEVEYRDGYLEIRGNKEQDQESEDRDGRYIRRERSYGTFKRSFYIGDINEDDINGSFTDGILNLDVPKADEHRGGRRIQIE